MNAMKRNWANLNRKPNGIFGATIKNDVAALKNALELKTGYASDDLAKALREACTHGYEECAALLLSAGAHVNFHDSSGTTPLIVAAKHGHASCVRLLLQSGAKVKCYQYPQRFSAMHYAAVAGCTSCVEILQKAGLDIDEPTALGRTPLMYAAKEGHTDVLRYLLRQGANVSCFDHMKCTALHFACGNGQVETARLILRAGGDVNAEDGIFMTPLLRAVEMSRLDVIKLLLREVNINVDVRSREQTLMHYAVRSKKVECVRLLLEYSVKYDEPTNAPYVIDRDVSINGRVTPLMLACGLGVQDIVEVLIAAGASITRKDCEGCSVLNHCIHGRNKNRINVMRALFENGVDLNCKDGDGNFTSTISGIKRSHFTEAHRNPLMQAMLMYKYASIRELLKANCDLRVVVDLFATNDDTYISPLEYAIMDRDPVMIRMLLIVAYPPYVQLNVDKCITHLKKKPHMENIIDKIMNRLRNPPTLQELARVRIRQCLNLVTEKIVCRLPLPVSFRNYLHLSDLDDIVLRNQTMSIEH